MKKTRISARQSKGFLRIIVFLGVVGMLVMPGVAYAEECHHLSVSAGEGGLVETTPANTYEFCNYGYGWEDVSIRAYPNPRYEQLGKKYEFVHFDIAGYDDNGNVSEEYTSDSSELTLTMDRAYDVVAIFEEVPVDEAGDEGYELLDSESNDNNIEEEEKIYYDLEVRVTGYGTVSPSGGKFVKGTKLTLIATPASGWRFVKWGGAASEDGEVIMDGDVSVIRVTALFEPDVGKVFTLTISSDEGGKTKPEEGVYRFVEYHPLWPPYVEVEAIPDSPEYVFAGWDGAPLLSKKDNPLVLTMNKNRTIHANFEIAPTRYLYVVIYGMGSVTKNPDKPNYYEGEKVTLEATPDAENGFYFSHWSDNKDNISVDNPLTVTMVDDITVTAWFFRYPKITVSGEGKGTITTNDKTICPSGGGIFVGMGSSTTFDIKADSGWKIYGVWENDVFKGGFGAETFSYTVSDVTSDRTLRVVFSQYCTLVITSSYGGHTYPSEGSYEYFFGFGGYVPIHAYPIITDNDDPTDDYVFIGWDGTPEGHETDNPLGLIMNRDYNIHAKFSKVTQILPHEGIKWGAGDESEDETEHEHGEYCRSLTLSASVGGKVSTSEGDAAETEPVTLYNCQSGYGWWTVTLTAEPEEGYYFVGWSGDASGDSKTIEVTVPMGTHKSVHAGFSKLTQILPQEELEWEETAALYGLSAAEEADDMADMSMEAGDESEEEPVLKDSQELQELVDSSYIGDIIEIEPGEYVFTSDLAIGKDITFVATDPENTTFVLGDYSIIIEEAEGGERIENVTIQGVTIRDHSGKAENGPIQNHAKNLTLSDCKVVDNKGLRASAVYTDYNTNLNLDNTLIANNRNTEENIEEPNKISNWKRCFAGTVYLDGRADLNMTNSTVAGNTNESETSSEAVNYGAVQRSWLNDVNIDDSIMWDNEGGNDVSSMIKWFQKRYIVNSNIQQKDIPGMGSLREVISVDPEFEDPVNKDYDVKDDSLCGIRKIGLIKE